MNDATNTAAAEADSLSRGIAPPAHAPGSLEARAAELGAHLARERGEDGTSPAAPAAVPAVPDYLKRAYDAEVAAGRLDRATADRLMREDAGLPADAATEPKADPVAAHLEQYGLPPARAEDFELPASIFPEDMPVSEAMATGQSIREIMSAARLPKATGDFLARALAEFEPVYAGMDDTAREIHRRESEARLKTMWKEQYDENLSLVRQLVGEIARKHPAVRDLLEETGAGNSVAVLVKLAEHARILDQRAR